MNCIAIDDEPLALNIIREFCGKVDFLNLVDTFINPIESLDLIKKGEVDLIFLDIHMPNITGLEFLMSIPRPPMVIFTTAYTQHALEGFNLDAIDYLVKPISFDRFLRAVNKANELHFSRKGSTVKENTKSETDFIWVKADYKTIKVNLNNIQFIEGVKDYVKMHIDGKNIITKTTMKNIEEKLPSEIFVRVHRSYIVSIHHIKAIENNRIIIENVRIPIGEMYKEEFYKRLDSRRI